MKRLIIKISIAICTFLLGVMVAVCFWSNSRFSTVRYDLRETADRLKPDVQASTTRRDLSVYSVNLCDLVNNSKQYDGKFVRVKAVHGGLGIDTPTYLAVSGCKKSISVTCSMNGDSCSQMYTRLRSIGGMDDPGALPEIEVIGLFKADATEPTPLVGTTPKRVKLLEIIELKGIETVRAPNH